MSETFFLGGGGSVVEGEGKASPLTHVPSG